MTLVRAAQVEALADSLARDEIVEALRRLKHQNINWWLSDTLAMAALAHEAQGRPDVAAYLLGGAERLTAGGRIEARVGGPYRRWPTSSSGPSIAYPRASQPDDLAARQAAGTKADIRTLLEIALTDLTGGT